MRLLVLASLGVVLGCDQFLIVHTISQYGGTPVPGVKVQAGESAWMSTDETGEARIPTPPSPFALQVHQVTTGPGGSGFQFDDVWILQSPEDDPTVLVDGNAVPRARVRVSGTVSGGFNRTVRVYASGDPTDSMWSSGVISSTFTLDAEWEKPGPMQSMLRAVETDGAPLPGRYFSYGETPVTLTDPGGGGTLSGVSVPLSAVIEGTVTGTIAGPDLGPGGTVSAGASLRFAGGGPLWLGGGPISAPLSVPFPEVAGAEAWLSVTAAGTASATWHERKVAVPSSGVAFDLPEPPQLLEPANGANIGTGTVFRWTGGPSGGRTALLMQCNWSDPWGTARGVSFRTLEVAGGSEATLPQLQDLVIEHGATCSWEVAWTPIGQHLGSTKAEAALGERRWSISESRAATFQ